jgi:hypothetical protein
MKTIMKHGKNVTGDDFGHRTLVVVELFKKAGE